MAAEGPFLSAIIARMNEAKFNLAAFGVAFSFAMLFESPIIMMLSASTSLVRDRMAFKKLRNFAYTLNGIITLMMLLFLIPPVFDFVAGNLIRLPAKVAELTYFATLILLPWPAAIGYRRFYQGILIKNNQTRRVAYGTVVRLASMALTGTLLYLLTSLPGALVGASALSFAVVFEALASKFMAASAVKKIICIEPAAQDMLTYKEIARFYYPLALTSLMILGVNPMVTFFMGQSRLPLESLALLPVINSFIFIFRSFGFSYQESSIALLKQGYIPIRNFAFLMAFLCTAFLALVTFSPLRELWFNTVSGLTMDLTIMSKVPLIILMFMPALEVLISIQRAILVESRKTKPITIATAIEVGGIIVILFIAIKYFNAVGVTAAAAAFIIGRMGANSYLFLPVLKSIRSFNFLQINLQSQVPEK